MMRWLIVLLSLVATAVAAEEVALSWTNPTETEQCSAGGAYLNPAGTRLWLLIQDIADPTANTFTLPAYKPGTYVFVATSYDTSGVGSRISGETEKTVTMFTAAAGSTVSQPVSIKNGFWLLPVGTVTSDIECIVEETVNGKYAIPNTGVSWSQGVIPKPLVVADCS